MAWADELDLLPNEFATFLHAAHQQERLMPLAHERGCVVSYPSRVQRAGAFSGPTTTKPWRR